MRRVSFFICLLLIFLLLSQHVEGKKKKGGKGKKPKVDPIVSKPEGTKEAPSKIDQILQNAGAGIDKVKETVKDNVEKGKDALNEVKDKVKDKVNEVKEKAKEVLNEKDKESTGPTRKVDTKAAASKKKELAKKREKNLQSRLQAARQKNERKANSRKKQEEKSRKALEKAYDTKDKIAKKKKEDDTPENRKRGEQKLAWLQQQTDQASNRIISLDTEAYKEYVNSGPRPYWIFIEYTALNPASRCSICHTMRDVTQPVAQAYYLRRHELKKQILESGEEYLPIFFVEVDVARNRELFGQLDLTSAPLVSLIPPRGSAGSFRLNQLLPKLKKYRFTAISPTMTSQDIGDFTYKLTGLKVELETPIAWTDLFLILLAAIAVFAFGWMYLDTLRKHRYLFFGTALLAYLFCISGGMYNYIRNTPFTQIQDNEVYYIARGSRSQNGVETWIVSAIVGFSTLVGLQLNRIAFREAETEFQKIVQKICFPLMSPILSFGLFAFAWYCLLKIYDSKNWGYHMGWVI